MSNSMRHIELFTSQRMPMLFVDEGDFSLTDFVEHFENKGTEVIVMGWEHKDETVFDFEERVIQIKETLRQKDKPVAVIFTGLHSYTPEMQQAILDIHFTTEHMVFGNICNHDNFVELSREFIDIFTIVD